MNDSPFCVDRVVEERAELRLLSCVAASVTACTTVSKSSFDANVLPVLFRISRMRVSSRNASSARLRSVMSRKFQTRPIVPAIDECSASNRSIVRPSSGSRRRSVSGG